MYGNFRERAGAGAKAGLEDQVSERNGRSKIFSNSASNADKNAALSAGAQGYLAKPFDPDELTETLRTAVKVASA